MTISDSTFRQDFFSDIRAILVAAGITSTLGSTVSNATVTASFNDKIINKPQVVIYPITKDEDNYKFGGTVGKRTANVVIESWAGDPGSCDQMADQITAAITGTTFDNMSLVSIKEEPAFETPGDNKYRLVTQTFVFERESNA